MAKRSLVYFHFLFTLVCLLLFVINAFFIWQLDIFGLPLFFTVALLAQLLLLIVFLYNLVFLLKEPFKIVLSILDSALKGIRKNQYIEKSQRKYPSLFDWISKRLSLSRPDGLILTTGVIISLFSFFGFLEIVQDVLFKEVLINVDQRIVNLIPNIRTPSLTSFFSFITFLANTQTIIALTFFALVFFFVREQRFAAIIFSLALFLEEFLGLVVKYAVGRVRPEQTLSLLSVPSFSFPSTHVLRATVLFGILSYYLFKTFTSHVLRLFIIVGYIIAVFLVAASRVYLGVHYPSDVLASILLGLSLLALFITLSQIQLRYHIFKHAEETASNGLLLIVPAFLIIWSVLLNPFFIQIRMVSPAPYLKTIQSISSQTVSTFPAKYSETLTGKPMEPISFIYEGDENAIKTAFSAHGWYLADPPSLTNTIKSYVVGFQNKQYLTAPVTPSYLGAKPQDLAFEKPTEINKLEQRHHTRIWKTDFALADETNIWVATASFDKGVELASSLKLPTHQIDPNIDAERDFIVKSLRINNPTYIQVVEPQLGKNASGDPFFTDGKAAVISLR